MPIIRIEVKSIETKTREVWDIFGASLAEVVNKIDDELKDGWRIIMAKEMR